MPSCNKLCDVIVEHLALRGETPSCSTTSGEYLYVGTSQGRVFRFIDAQPFALATYAHLPLPNQFARVSALACSDTLLACALENGTVYLFGLFSTIKVGEFFYTSGRIEHLLFLDPKTLLIVYRGGLLYIQKLDYNAKASKIDIASRNITQILPPIQNRFLLVVADSTRVALIDLIACKTLCPRFVLTQKTIKNIELVDNMLTVHLSDATSYRLDLYDTQELDSLLLHNSLDIACQRVEHNPLLTLTPTYKKLQKRYESLYKEAFEALHTQKEERFLRFIDMFLRLDSKQKEMQLFLETYRVFPRFCELIQEKKYPLAYAMSKKLPPLQETTPYKQLQNIWQDSFLRAQKALLNGDKFKAEETLKPFMGVLAKRETIRLFLSDNGSFRAFIKSLEEQEFAKAHEIATINKNIAKLPNYKTMQKSLEHYFETIWDAMLEGETCRAEEMLQKAPLTQHAKELSEKNSVVKEFYGAYEAEDFTRCYEMLDTYEYLYQSRLGVMLEKHWAKQIVRAENAALKGDVVSLRESFGDINPSHARRNLIASIYKLGFHAKIDTLLRTKNYRDAERFIYSYLDIFGNDATLTMFMKLFESQACQKLALTVPKC